jgi:hypothetical protein
MDEKRPTTNTQYPTPNGNLARDASSRSLLTDICISIFSVSVDDYGDDYGGRLESLSA